MLRKLLGTVFAIAVAAAPAEAQWKYEFSGTFLDGPMTFNQDGSVATDGRVSTLYQFVLFSATPIVGPGQVSPSSCSVSNSLPDVYYVCEPPGPGMAQDGFGTGISLVDAKFKKFSVSDDSDAGGGGAWFFFTPSAFFTPGTYQTYAGTISAPNPDFDQTLCDEFQTNCDELNFYGSAGEATLIVKPHGRGS